MSIFFPVYLFIVQVDKDDDQIYANVTLPFQAERLVTTVQAVFGVEQQFDVVGFSLGGRIALAAATLADSKIARLHLTGVATERSLSGLVALQAWTDLTRSNNLQGFGWSALQTTYSPTFLHSNKDKLSGWVQYVCQSNSAAGLHALLEQTHPESSSDLWHVSSMAERSSVKGRLVVGECDVMAPLPNACALANALGWDPPHVVPGCGHAVPIENPRAWRQSVLEFLDQS